MAEQQVERLTCPLQPEPVPLDEATFRQLVEHDMCPLSCAGLEPWERTQGYTADGQAASLTTGRCPDPCNTEWQPRDETSIAWYGRAVRVEYPEPAN